MSAEPVLLSSGPEITRCAGDLADAHAKIENLEHALSTARMIGAAVGIVMATKKLTYDAAFEFLVTHSQQRNAKLRLMADEVVLTGVL